MNVIQNMYFSFKDILVITDNLNISFEIAIRWIPQDLRVNIDSDDEATSHYLS